MMKWRRWLIGILCILALAGVYSARRTLITSYFSSKFPVRIASKSTETSFENSTVRYVDAQVQFGDGLRVQIDRAEAILDMRSIWKGDLIVNELDIQGVRVPTLIPNTPSIQLPTLPDELGTPPDVQAWIEPWLSDLAGSIDRDVGRVPLAAKELISRADQLRSDLDRTLLSQRSNLEDRRYTASMAKEFHAIKQRMAELRIQARGHGKDHAKRWAQASESLSERFQSKLMEMVPDADLQIQQLAKTYSQRVCPTVLAYCDLVCSAMKMSPMGKTPAAAAGASSTNQSSSLIRRASLTGQLVDSSGSKLSVPFECQSCQWAWGGATEYPTTSVWNFELPDRKGRLEIQAQRRLGGQGPSEGTAQILMDCHWYIAPGDQAFEANPSRLRIQVQQGDDERTVSLVAPWDPRQSIRASEQLRLSPLAISFRQALQRPDRLEPQSIPVAWESIAVEPRILFEMESALEYNKRQWLSHAQEQWNQFASATIASKQEQSYQMWQSVSSETMDQLRKLDLQMAKWQELWDASTSIQQHRVGNKLSVHPDTYLLPSR